MASSIEELNQSFRQEYLKESFLISSVPKCGTMLLRNILVMFVPLEQIHWPFLSQGDLASAFEIAQPNFFTGHINRTPHTILVLKNVRQLVLIRDPREYVMAYSRFLFSPEIKETCALAAYAQHYGLSLGDLIPCVIKGWRLEFGELREDHPSVAVMFITHALAWTGNAYLVRYEQLCHAVSDLNSEFSQQYFRSLLAACGIQMPEDWKKRVEVGSDRAISSTASERFSVPGNRQHLTERELTLLNAAAPGLLDALGY